MLKLLTVLSLWVLLLSALSTDVLQTFFTLLLSSTASGLIWPSSDLRRNFILCRSISKAGHLEISTQLSRNGRLRRSIRGVTCCSAGFKLTDSLIWDQHNCLEA